MLRTLHVVLNRGGVLAAVAAAAQSRKEQGKRLRGNNVDPSDQEQVSACPRQASRVAPGTHTSQDH